MTKDELKAAIATKLGSREGRDTVEAMERLIIEIVGEVVRDSLPAIVRPMVGPLVGLAEDKAAAATEAALAGLAPVGG